MKGAQKGVEQDKQEILKRFEPLVLSLIKNEDPQIQEDFKQELFKELLEIIERMNVPNSYDEKDCQ
ncbi:helix-turn-helix domain-containing protein [Litoribacterium kuwaitense]|uniref:helix-turn-helix domain-containing protein n=1 Tax=Litoribacterium kuwaitense TaxID=1398745 RepID=UPI0035E40D7B